MIIDEAKYREKFLKKENEYKVWGNYVNESILSKLESPSLLRIPPKVRLKEFDSFIRKIMLKGHKYTNPLDDITDRVGIRYVVLYRSEIELIKSIIMDSLLWESSKDRDYIDEIDLMPEKFGYESVHFIVRAKAELYIEGMLVPKGLPCEIQIRTLLQHAYCEMSHDLIYKNNVHNNIKRHTARSMALIDSSDYFFEEVRNMVINEEDKYAYLFPKLQELYQRLCHQNDFDTAFNNMIIDTYRDFIEKDTFEQINILLQAKSFLVENVKDYYQDLYIYRQPVVFLLYYFLQKDREMVKTKWPLTFDELKPLLIDLGISTREY